MSPLPYLPAGVSELPAERFILFADTTNLVQKIDESAKTFNGVSFTGVWESGSLNSETFRELTLRYITLVYISAVPTTVTISASGDGGETWSQTRVLNIVASTASRLRRVQYGFNVTGFDLRIKIELNTDEVFQIYELHPVLVVRGEHDVT